MNLILLTGPENLKTGKNNHFCSLTLSRGYIDEKNRKRQISEIYHNRSTALERSVINHWGWGGVLKPVLRARNLAPSVAVVHENTSYSVRVKDF